MSAAVARAAARSDASTWIVEPQRRDVLALPRAGERPVTEAGEQRLHGLDVRAPTWPTRSGTGSTSTSASYRPDREGGEISTLRANRTLSCGSARGAGGGAGCAGPGPEATDGGDLTGADVR
ncbi:hypothetical protein GCM10027451_37870 [Geodermatophilus aquaeductus]